VPPPLPCSHWPFSKAYEESRHPAHLVLQTPGRRVHRARWCRLCRGTIRDVAPRCSLNLPLGTAARSAYRRLAPVRDPVNPLRQRTARHQSRYHYHGGWLRRSGLSPSDYAAVVRSEAPYACAVGGRHDWHRGDCRPRGGHGGINGCPQAGSCGRIVSRSLQSLPDHDPLLEAMDRLSADAAAKGLTPETLEAELAAHKAERTR
jgi:hypothetical protein